MNLSEESTLIVHLQPVIKLAKMVQKILEAEVGQVEALILLPSTDVQVQMVLSSFIGKRPVRQCLLLALHQLLPRLLQAFDLRHLQAFDLRHLRAFNPRQYQPKDQQKERPLALLHQGPCTQLNGQQ